MGEDFKNNQERIDFLLKKIEEDEIFITNENNGPGTGLASNRIEMYKECLKYLEDEKYVVEDFKYFEYGGQISFSIIETFKFTKRSMNHSMGCFDCPCCYAPGPPNLECQLIPIGDSNRTFPNSWAYWRGERNINCPLVGCEGIDNE